LLLAFRTFKYLRLNIRLSLLWNALRKAGGDIISFMIMFFVLLFGFLLFGWISFGQDVGDFNTFANSWGSCWNFVMGNPPAFNELSQSNRVLGPIFFMLFTISLFFVMVNMFVAILSDSLTMVRAERKAKKKENLHVKQSLEEIWDILKHRFCVKKYISLKQLVKRMKNPAILDHPSIDDMKEVFPEATHKQIDILTKLHLSFHASRTNLVTASVAMFGRGIAEVPRDKSAEQPVIQNSEESEVIKLRQDISILLARIDDLVQKKKCLKLTI